MQQILILTAAIFTVSFLPSFADEKKVIEQDVVIKINGMTCEACVQGMNKVFSKEESVQAVYASLENQIITVDTKDSPLSLTDEKINELVEWGGYDLISIERAN